MAFDIIALIGGRIMKAAALKGSRTMEIDLADAFARLSDGRDGLCKILVSPDV